MPEFPDLSDPHALLQEAIQEMLLQFQDVLVPVGVTLFRSIAIILLAWFGLQTALGASEGRGLPIARFVRLVLSLAVGHALVTYYVTPIPGIGYTLPGLIRLQAAWLVGRLHTSATVEVFRAMDELWLDLESPGFMDVTGALLYISFGLVCGLLKTAIFFVISFGFVAVAVLTVLGPLFLPFLVVPFLDFLFWNWLRSLLTYAFYQVVAEVYVTVFASFLLRFIEPFRRAGFDLAMLNLAFTFVLMVFLAFVFGVFKIPSLTASLFAGRGGESTAGETIGAITSATAVVTRAARTKG